MVAVRLSDQSRGERFVLANVVKSCVGSAAVNRMRYVGKRQSCPGMGN